MRCVIPIRELAENVAARYSHSALRRIRHCSPRSDVAEPCHRAARKHGVDRRAQVHGTSTGSPLALKRTGSRIDGIGRVRGRNINRALSAGSLRQHRITSKGVLLRDLLWLDYVLEHSRLLSSPASRRPRRCAESPAEPVLVRIEQEEVRRAGSPRSDVAALSPRRPQARSRSPRAGPGRQQAVRCRAGSRRDGRGTPAGCPHRTGKSPACAAV